MQNEPQFNLLANTYDVDFTFTIIGDLQRKRVWHFLNTYVVGSTKKQILEINCGTGEDAKMLASLGHEVVATDLSDKMIRVAQNKLNGVEHVQLKTLGFHQLKSELPKELKYDIIFSNFAGLNCVDPNGLQQLNKDFNDLLASNGKLIVVLLGKKCWMENLYFFLKGEYKKMYRRRNKAMAVLKPNHLQETFYYTVQEFSQLFSSFKIVESKPIGLFIPPSYLNDAIKNKSIFLRLIAFLEKCFGGLSFLSNYGDHTFIVLEKK